MIPVRAEARHASEMVSQLLFGESFEVLESNTNWHRIKMCYDDYEGYIFSRVLEEITPEEAIGRNSAIQHLSPTTFRYNILREDIYVNPGSFIKDQIFTALDPAQLLMQYIGSPYLWGGRSIYGIDCSGLSQIFYKLMGIPLPRDASQQVLNGQPIPDLSSSKVYDLVFFSEFESEKISHVGILLSPSEILHASDRVRVDPLREHGIFNPDIGKLTLKIRHIRRYI